MWGLPLQRALPSLDKTQEINHMLSDLVMSY